MNSCRFVISVCLLGMLVSCVMMSPLMDRAKSTNTVTENESGAENTRRYENFLNELVDAENGLADENDSESDSESDGGELYMSKKSAPRRIFIGKRHMPTYDEFLNDYESGDAKRALYLSRLNKYLNSGKRNGQQQIHRIFIGKRGDIKRIFIG